MGSGKVANLGDSQRPRWQALPGARICAAVGGPHRASAPELTRHRSGSWVMMEERPPRGDCGSATPLVENNSMYESDCSRCEATGSIVIVKRGPDGTRHFDEMCCPDCGGAGGRELCLAGAETALYDLGGEG